MKSYLYRRGDGNDGNFPRMVVQLKDTDCPFAALRALIANEYIARGRVRRYIVNHCEVDGEAEYGVHAVVHEGPEGETAYEAAWLTAELQPLTDADLAHERDYGRTIWMLRRALDGSALKLYRRLCKAK